MHKDVLVMLLQAQLALKHVLWAVLKEETAPHFAYTYKAHGHMQQQGQKLTVCTACRARERTET